MTISQRTTAIDDASVATTSGQQQGKLWATPNFARHDGQGNDTSSISAADAGDEQPR